MPLSPPKICVYYCMEKWNMVGKSEIFFTKFSGPLADSHEIKGFL